MNWQTSKLRSLISCNLLDSRHCVTLDYKPLLPGFAILLSL